VNSAFVAGEIASTTDANSGKDHSFTYLACCAALGLLVSVVSTAVTPPEWLPEYAAWESTPAGWMLRRSKSRAVCRAAAATRTNRSA